MPPRRPGINHQRHHRRRGRRGGNRATAGAGASAGGPVRRQFRNVWGASAAAPSATAAGGANFSAGACTPPRRRCCVLVMASWLARAVLLQHKRRGRLGHRALQRPPKWREWKQSGRGVGAPTGNSAAFLRVRQEQCAVSRSDGTAEIVCTVSPSTLPQPWRPPLCCALFAGRDRAGGVGVYECRTCYTRARYRLQQFANKPFHGDLGKYNIWYLIYLNSKQEESEVRQRRSAGAKTSVLKNETHSRLVTG